MPELTRSQVLTTAAIVFLVVFVGTRALSAQRAGDPAGATGATRAGAAPADAAATATSPDGGPVAVSEPAQQPALVHVAGAVRRPGVYRLPAGARVDDAIRRAGGARGRADLDLVNLAAKVTDGQQILVPRRGAAASPAPGVDPGASAAVGAGAVPAAPLDLNAATAEQLDTLDGVGPATAQKILAYRTEHGGFRSVDELAQVPGIGPKKLAALRERVHV